MEKSALTALAELATGMSGTVYVTTTRIPSHPGGNLVYKEYNQHPDRSQWLNDAARAISWRNSLAHSDRQTLDSFAAWPIEMVTDKNQLVGCLIPRIPDRFFINQRQPDGTHKPVPRTFEKLIGTPHQLATLGMDLEAATWTPELRLALAAHLTFSIRFLHKYGIVYGDISLKNAVFDAQNPGVMLLDCDAVASVSDPTRRQANSPAFLAPECTPLGTNRFSRGRATFQDHATDVYKLAQVLLKTLVAGDRPSQRKGLAEIRSHLSPTIYQAVSEALAVNPARRISANYLYDAIYDEINRLIQPPTIAIFKLSLATLPRGTDTELAWQVSGATDLCIQGPNGFNQPIPLQLNRWSLTPLVSGEYALVASNRFGESRVTCNVQVFDMPDLRLDVESLTAKIAPPDLPQVPTPQVNLPSITPVEALLATTMPDVPNISAPSLEGLLTLTSLTQSISAINASPIPPIPNVDARLTESAELSLSQVVIDLANLPDLLAAPLRTVESAAAAAAEEAAQRAVERLMNQSGMQQPPGAGGTP